VLNLGFDSIYSVLIPLVDELRENQYEYSSTSFNEIEESYHEICNIIKEYTTDN
jgi:hypothetical protein